MKCKRGSPFTVGPDTIISDCGVGDLHTSFSRIRDCKTSSCNVNTWETITPSTIYTDNTIDFSHIGYTQTKLRLLLFLDMYIIRVVVYSYESYE